MRTKPGFPATLFAVAALGAAVGAAPIAGAVPECTATGPTTTLCQTPGHAQITTSPPAMDYSPWTAFLFGGVGIIGLGL